MTLLPDTIDQLREHVRAQATLNITGAGTKTGLAGLPDGRPAVCLRSLAGVVEYTPEECTFTARAGTSLLAIEEVLARHGQYLPFDPPFVRAGATLGGTVAAGLSGSGRYRYGGVRDFIIGAHVVDGEGRLIRTGGRVVKNAAGFLLHHALVGSRGRFGAIVEIACKVFPMPESRVTLSVECADFLSALRAMRSLQLARLDLDAVDIEPPGALWIRLGGFAESMPSRIAAVRDALGCPSEVCDGQADARVWDDAREFAWLPAGASLVKVPVTPTTVPGLEQVLDDEGCTRRYACAANVAWIGWTNDIDRLSRHLSMLSLTGQVIVGAPRAQMIGSRKPDAFEERCRRVLDPTNRFSGS